MRGTGNTNSETSKMSPETVAVEQSIPTAATSTIEDNTKSATAPGSIWAWLAALLLVCLLAGVRKNEKVQDALEPNKVLDIGVDVLTFGLIAGVGIKGLHVLLVKLAAMKIPVLSKIAGFFLPVYS